MSLSAYALKAAPQSWDVAGLLVAVYYHEPKGAQKNPDGPCGASGFLSGRKNLLGNQASFARPLC